MTAKKKQTVLDEPWPWSHISTPVIWAVLVLAVAWILDSQDIGAGPIVLVGVVVTVIIPTVATAFDSPLSSRWCGGLLAASVTGFLAWTSVTTPWQQATALPLVLGAFVFGAWWHVIRRTSDQAAAAQAKQARKQARAIERGDMPDILAGAGFRGIEGSKIEMLPNDVGTVQRLMLPANGSVTFSQLHAATEKVMIAARAKHPIRFTPGDHAAEVVCVRMFRDILAETIPYPIDRTGGRSIHDPIPLGLTEMGEEAGLTKRELSGKIIGERGSGKSNTVNNFLAYLTGCTDALVWMIDGKGGRTARPWVDALDWIATTPGEADKMLAAGLAVINSRSGGDGEKVEPSRRQPGIILVIEESSLITGVGDTDNNRRAQLAQKIVVLGRSEAVDVLLIGQRGTITMLGTGDMASQLQYTIGLGIRDMNDARRAFKDASTAREVLRYSSDDRYKGVQLVEMPGYNSILPIKGYRLNPDLIPGVARTNARYKPQLEEAAALAADAAGGYLSRWDRWSAGDTGRDTSGDMSPGHGGDTGQGPRPQSTAERLGLPESPIVAQVLRDMKARRDTPDQQAGGMSPGQELEMLRAMYAAPAADSPDVPVDEAAQVVPPILLTVNAIFAALGAERLHTRTILEHLPGDMTGRAFGILMAACGVAKVPEPFEVDGERTRGYAAEEFRRAIHRARQGAKLPPAAFSWPDG